MSYPLDSPTSTYPVMETSGPQPMNMAGYIPQSVENKYSNLNSDINQSYRLAIHDYIITRIVIFVPMSHLKTKLSQPQEMPPCSPMCDFECQNGGNCSAPNTCTCTEQYRGTYCQLPKEQECELPPAPVPNGNIHVT